MESHKHIVNKNKREHINRVCQADRISTDNPLYTHRTDGGHSDERITRKSNSEFDPETYTNPILEECYRIKAEISAQFKTLELNIFAYWRATQEEE